MSQTADQPSADQTPGDVPPHRYTPALAQQIELAWQDRWEREGTFHTPNPVGPAERGLRAGRRPAQVLRDGHVPVPLGCRPARRPPAGLPGHRRHQPVPPDGRRQRPAPDGLRRLRPARRAVRRPDRAAPADHHRGQHRGDPRAAAPAGRRPRRPPQLRHHRPGLLQVDPVDLPAAVRVLVRRAGRQGAAGSRSWSPSWTPGRASRRPGRTRWAGRGPSWTRSAGGWSSTRTGWPICTRRRSTGARAWARCCRTRRSPPTGAPSGATSRCSGVR